MSLFDKFKSTAEQYDALVAAGGRDPFGVSMDEMLGPTRAMVKGRATGAS